VREDGRHVVEDHLDLAAEQIGDRGRCAAIGHVLHLGARHRHEHFTRQMHRRAVARRRQVHLARIGLHIGDELGDRFRRHVIADRHHIRHAIERRDRRYITDEVELQVGVERGIDVVRRVHQQQRVTIGFGIDHRFGGDVVAGAGLVLDHELLAEPLGEPLADQPRDDIGRSARRISDNPAHRPGRIIQRRGAADRSDCRNAHCDQTNRGAT